LPASAGGGYTRRAWAVAVPLAGWRSSPARASSAPFCRSAGRRLARSRRTADGSAPDTGAGAARRRNAGDPAAAAIPLRRVREPRIAGRGSRSSPPCDATAAATPARLRAGSPGRECRLDRRRSSSSARPPFLPRLPRFRRSARGRSRRRLRRDRRSSRP